MVEWLKHGQSHVGDQELQRLWHQYAKVVEYELHNVRCRVTVLPMMMRGGFFHKIL